MAMRDQCSLLNLILLCLFSKAVCPFIQCLRGSYLLHLPHTCKPCGEFISGTGAIGDNTSYHLLNIFKERQQSTLCFYFCDITNSLKLPLYFQIFAVPVSPCLLISLQGRGWDFQMLIFIELFLR